MKALDVAKWFIITANKEEDSADITNMKVNKLCYYAFLLFYKRTKKKLFNETIYAWQHGPVIKEVYNDYKCCGSNVISNNYDYEDLSITDEEKKILQETYDNFAIYTAIFLRKMTHNESPWKNHYKIGIKDIVIPDQSLFDFAMSYQFSNLLDEEETNYTK